MTLRLLSYNIHGGIGTDGRHDYERINHFLEEQNIDIVLFQEVDMRPAERPTADDIAKLCGNDYPHFITAAAIEVPQGWYGNAIMSRYPVLGYEVVDITVKGREPRNIIDAVIQTPHGPLRVLNTHKGLKRRERHQQMEKLDILLARENDLPFILAGDINEWHTSAPVIKALNQRLTPHTVGATFPTRFPLFHLDRFWSRPGNIIQKAAVLKTKETKIFSDHYPIMAEIDLAGFYEKKEAVKPEETTPAVNASDLVEA